MKNINLENQIEQYLSHITVRNSTDRLNMCADIYYLLKGAENASDGFSYFMENVDSIKSDRTRDVSSKYSEDDLKELENQLGAMTDAVFEKIIKANLQENQFYQELWKALTQSYVFGDDKSVIFAIYYIVIDSRIPYFYIPTSTAMSDAKFKDITQSIRKDIDKVRYIINTNQFDQWTMQAVALLDVLDTKQNEERIVLMAHVLKLLDTKKDAQNPELSEKVFQAIRQRLLRR